MRTLKFIFRKGLIVVLTLLMVTFLSFTLMRFSKIDPAMAYVKRHTAIVTDEQIDEARKMLGLDKPLIIQYSKWIKNVIFLDFGISLATGHPVKQELKQPIIITIKIVILTSIIMFIGVVLFGSLHYLKRNSLWGAFFNFWSIMGISIPSFFVAIVFLNIFSSWLNLMDVAGNTGFFKYFPTAFCLSIPGVSFYSEMLFGSLERQMAEDYAFYAQCRGLSERRVLFFHALPHAIADLIPSFAQMIGLILASSVIVERVFSLPGIGYLIVHSVVRRDSPVIHATILFLALILLCLDFSASIIQKYLQRNIRVVT